MYQEGASGTRAYRFDNVVEHDNARAVFLSSLRDRQLSNGASVQEK